MTTALTFRVEGRPQGARRPRAVRRGAHAGVHMPDDHVTAERHVTAAALEAWAGRPRLEGPVVVEITTWHERPQAQRRKRDARALPAPYAGKPDADNVAKLVLDGITKAGVWRDDAQVHRLVVERWYLPLCDDSRSIGTPHVHVRVMG